MSTTKCLLFPITNISLLDEEQLKGENKVLLPPTPITSDDEDNDNISKPIRLARRGTVSLVDLIPVASAALRAKHRLSSAQVNNPPSTQDSPLARALTKVKIGVQTHRIKERYLTNEWIRLALAAPLDETTINTNSTLINMNRTKEIVKWYEYKFKRTRISLQELEETVDSLRRQKLLLQTTCLLPSPPATRLTF